MDGSVEFEYKNVKVTVSRFGNERYWKSEFMFGDDTYVFQRLLSSTDAIERAMEKIDELTGQGGSDHDSENQRKTNS